MLIQIHRKFKDGHTELIIQGEVNNYEDNQKLINEAKEKFPCPEGYLICTEESEFFQGTPETVCRMGGPGEWGNDDSTGFWHG